MLSRGCNGRPAELAGRDGGLEGGFEENGCGLELTILAGTGLMRDEKGKDERGDCGTSSRGSIFNDLGTLSSSVIEDAHRFLDSKSGRPVPSWSLESPLGRRGVKGGPAADLDRFGGEARTPGTGGEGLSLGGLAPSANLVAAISSETSAMAFLS